MAILMTNTNIQLHQANSIGHRQCVWHLGCTRLRLPRHKNVKTTQKIQRFL